MYKRYSSNTLQHPTLTHPRTKILTLLVYDKDVCYLNLGSILFLWSSMILLVSTFIWRTEIALISFPFTCIMRLEHRPSGKNNLLLMNGCTSSSTSPSTVSGTLEFAFMSLLTVNESCNMNYAFSKKHSTQCTVICRLKAFGLYIFVRGFRRVYNRRGLYPRGFITDVEKALRNKPSAVLIKLSFAFTVLLKLQNFIINRIHLNTS